LLIKPGRMCKKPYVMKKIGVAISVSQGYIFAANIEKP
jgi:hypothetical protein